MVLLEGPDALQADQAAGFRDLGDSDFPAGRGGADLGDEGPAAAGNVCDGRGVGFPTDAVAEGDFGVGGVCDAERIHLGRDRGIVVGMEFHAQVAITPLAGSGGDERLGRTERGAAETEADDALDLEG